MKFIEALLAKNEPRIIGICRESAVFSFIIGTAIFLLYLVTHSSFFVILGLIFTVVAVLINFTFLISLIIKIFIDKEKRKKIAVSIILIALNIPIAISYFYKVLDTLTVGGE